MNHVQGDPSGLRLYFVDFGLGLSPSMPIPPDLQLPRQNLSQQNVVSDLTGHPVRGYEFKKSQSHEVAIKSSISSVLESCISRKWRPL